MVGNFVLVKGAQIIIGNNNRRIETNNEILANRFALSTCCKRNCLWSQTKTLPVTYKLILSCLEELQNLSKSEKKDYMR
jgi:hypothetical protein